MKKYAILFAVLCMLPASVLMGQPANIKKKPTPFTILVEDHAQKTWYAVSESETSLYEWVVLLRGIAFGKDDITVQDGATAMGFSSVYELFAALKPDTLKVRNEIIDAFRPLLDVRTEEDFIVADFYNEEWEKYLWNLPYTPKRWGDLPMTGITYEQAQLFCKWRTYMAAQSISAELMNNEGLIDKYNKDYEITFRMPTEAEFDYWIMCERIAALDKKKQPQAYKDIAEKGVYPAIDSMNTKGCILWNFKIEKPCENAKELHAKYGDGCVPGRCFFPSSIGIYDVMGNVAEMVQEKGIAKGGSYAHYAYEGMPRMRQPYAEAQPWLGFRYVIVFKKKEE